MDKFIIKGGNKLSGTVQISGSKNCSLPVLFATLLSEKVNRIANLPRLNDMESTMKMLLHLGATVEQKCHNTFGADWLVDAANVGTEEAPYDLVRKMRASILCLGPLLARFGKARVSLPGGCAIGTRPIDFHLEAFKKMGAVIESSGGYVHAKVPPELNGRLKGAKIIFPFASVGATENVAMAATLANGETIIENAAREPEIVDFCESLITMGAKITGHGSSTIHIQGQKELEGMDFVIPPDRIETATYLIAAQLVGGELFLKGARRDDVESIIEGLEKSGAKVIDEADGLRCTSSEEILPVDQLTAPFPAFPTDAQAQWVALMVHANGITTVTEDVFENRFMHVPELSRMGADLEIIGNTVKIKGGGRNYLSGAPVMATDLRASASLVLAALASHGTSEIKRIYHLDRGYESMELKLRAVGADVERAAD